VSTLLFSVVAAGLMFVFGFGSGVSWHKGQVAKQIVEQAVKVDEVAEQNEIVKERIVVKYIKVKQNVDKIVKDPFYAGDCLDDGGL